MKPCLLRPSPIRSCSRPNRRPSASAGAALVRVALLACALLVVSQIEAQEQWTSVASTTRQNLWSVAAGAGRFVAVGENGAVVTSADGIVWTTRSAGTTAWLVGVTYANDRFVAVGDKGTLLTSTDGVTWATRASGTTERLNAVAFGNERWLAVGENGSAVTSADAVTWTPVARSDRGWTNALSGWLRGLCFAYGQFVATGQRGHVVTTADMIFYTDASVETAVDLEAVTYAQHRFVAVGDGLVLTSRDAGPFRDASSWRGRPGPRAMRALTFFNNTFVAATTDGAIFTSADAVNWTARNAALNRPLTAVAANDAVVVAVGFGGTILRSDAAAAAPTIVAPPDDVTEAVGNNVLLSVTATGSAPLSYQWSFAGTPIAGATSDTLPLRAVTTANAGAYHVTVTNALGSATSRNATLGVIPEFPAVAPITDLSPGAARGATALLVLPNGKVLVASSTVLRLNADGTLDPTFTPAAVQGVQAMAVQPDGKVLVGGTGNGVSAFLLRLTADGQVDGGFSRPANLPGPTITGFALQPDGKILLANATARPVRLNSDGSIDTSFNAPDLTALAADIGVPAIKRVAVGSDGRIVVAAAVADAVVPISSSGARGRMLVARLLADGTLDPTFTPVRTGTREPQLLSVLTDGRILLGSDDSSGSFGFGSWKIQRLNADGSDDATFASWRGSITKYGGRMRATLDSKGRIVAAVSFNNVDPGLRVFRFDQDGRVDPTLRASQMLSSSLGNPLVAVAPDELGRVWVVRSLEVFRMVERNAPAINPPVPLVENAAPLTLRAGDDVTITPLVAGTGPFQHEWSSFTSVDEAEYVNAPAATSVTFFARRNDQVFGATVGNAAGTLTLPPQVVRVPPLAPSFSRPPADLALERGRFGEITFQAYGSGPLHYQWLLNGATVAEGEVVAGNSSGNPDLAVGSAGALAIYGMTPAQAGDYELVLTNPSGSVRSRRVTVTLAPTSRLVDLATRATVGTGDRALIAGFAIAGSESKWVLVRGLGPALSAFGVAGALADPKLALFDANGTRLEENDDWVGTAESYSAANWPATFPLTTGSRDAIIARRLPPGNYTAQLTGSTSSAGIGLLEVYEDIHGMPRLANLSSRVFVAAGDVAISGVVVGGELPRRVLVRAVGPTLTGFGIGGVLSDPALAVLDAAGNRIAENNDWTSNAAKADVVRASIGVGAFALPDPSKDAAVLLTLSPGSYTMHVSGASGESGIALVEIYELP